MVVVVGCILADDMGLGKTLQSIVLIWTVLKQGLPQGMEGQVKIIYIYRPPAACVWIPQVHPCCSSCSETGPPRAH